MEAINYEVTTEQPSKLAASGNGYFQGKYLGFEAVAKSKKHFPSTPGHRGFFRFTIDNSTELKKFHVLNLA